MNMFAAGSLSIRRHPLPIGVLDRDRTVGSFLERLCANEYADIAVDFDNPVEIEINPQPLQEEES